MSKKYLGMALLASSLYAANTSGYNVRAYYDHVPSSHLINNNYNINKYVPYKEFKYGRLNNYDCNKGKGFGGIKNSECYYPYFDSSKSIFFDKNIEFYWRNDVSECHTARLSNQFLCEPVKRTDKKYGHRDPDGGPLFIQGDETERTFYNRGQWKATWEGLVRLNQNLVAGIRYKVDWGKHNLNLHVVNHENDIQAAIFIPNLDWYNDWDLQLYRLRNNDNSDYHSQRRINGNGNYLYYPGITRNNVNDNHNNDSPKRYGSVGYYAWQIPSLFSLADIKSCASGSKCPYVYLRLNYIPGSDPHGRGIYLTWRQRGSNNDILYAAIPPEAFVPFDIALRVVEKSYLEQYNSKDKDINYVMKSGLANKYPGEAGEYCLVETIVDTKNNVYVPYKANFEDKAFENKYDIKITLEGNGEKIVEKQVQQTAFNNFPNRGYDSSCFKLPEKIKNGVGKVTFELDDTSTNKQNLKYNHVLKDPNSFLIQLHGTWGGKNLDVSGKNVKGSGKYIGNDVQVPYKNNKIGW